MKPPFKSSSTICPVYVLWWEQFGKCCPFCCAKDNWQMTAFGNWPSMGGCDRQPCPSRVLAFNILTWHCNFNLSSDGSRVFQSPLSHASWMNVKHSGSLWSDRDIQAFMSSSEDTSLLSTENNAGHDRHHDVYLRFSSTRKNIILAMVSGCVVIHCMFIHSESTWRSMSYVWVDSMIGTFTPSIPQIAKDLKSTGAVVKWSILQDLFTKMIYFPFSV